MSVPDFSYDASRQAPCLSPIEAAWPMERAQGRALKENGGSQSRRKIPYHNNKVMVYSFLGGERKKNRVG